MQTGDLLAIKEFSKLTGIKETTLRYYDDIELFSPSMRGENNYRYYSPRQLITINSINLLRRLDMPVKEICETVRVRTPESIYALFGQKEEELAGEMRRLKQSYDVIRTFRNMISTALSATEGQISVVHMEEQRIILGDYNDFSTSNSFYDAFLKFCSDAPVNDINLDYPIGGLYQSFETYLSAPGQPTYFFSADPNANGIKEAAQYLVMYGRGFYGEMGNTPEIMTTYLRKHALIPVGSLYIIYLEDEICMRNQEQYLYQVSMKVK